MCSCHIDQEQTGSWLSDALRRGDLATAWSEASDLPALNLSDALALVVLMAARRHPAFDRAGARLGRAAGARALDGPVDATSYINDPLRNLSAQSSGFERALARFLQACARDQVACHGFGGAEPSDAYDQLLARLDAAPVPTADGRAVDGDEVRAGTLQALYSKSSWTLLADALVDRTRSAPWLIGVVTR